MLHHSGHIIHHASYQIISSEVGERWPVSCVMSHHQKALLMATELLLVPLAEAGCHDIVMCCSCLLYFMFALGISSLHQGITGFNNVHNIMF